MIKTKQELLEKLRAISVSSLEAEGRHRDVEGNHLDADSWLLEYIADPEITLAFEAIEKWYA